MSTALRRGHDPVLVIGGGVVGLSVAYYLAAKGVPVEVVERRSVASGASWGNAGWVCASHSAPVPAPGVIRYAVGSLGRPDSPLYLRPAPDPSLLRWLWRFWRSSKASAFRAGYTAVADLNQPTFDLFAGLAEAGVDTTLTRPGLVHAFLSADQARHHLDVQRAMADGRYDVPDGVLTGSEAAGLDPALSSAVQAAYLVEGEGVVDPGRLVTALADAVTRLGGRITEKVEVTGFRRTADGTVVGAVTEYGEIPCAGVVVAAGIWSRELARLLGHRLPLQAGKGYSFSVELDPAPRHAMYFGDKRIVASPIGGITRIAGTMELSGNNNDLDWRRIVAIARGSRHYLGPWFHHPDELVGLIRDPWVGGRPFLPDGLPVIDRLPGIGNAFVATGHGMLGVTLGPATGTAVTDYILTGARPDVLAPFGFGRL
ncbi:FAD-dependent oxidoreductase [Kribbella capetownensis]|uniref:FAD-dependent oxidoreductase n=1 Tax=Kribbella capetownensis TaxID=1572659 RepID=A0A4R0JKJ6_9ACTN|nr:FAD-dependent oxidoreductase [Kribbella capetownensis]TCC46830.1 FAD-dependent oxidoreductase [Kribbella capetownensis]